MHTPRLHTRHPTPVKKYLLMALCVGALCLPFIFSDQTHAPDSKPLKPPTKKANPASLETLQYTDTAQGRSLRRGVNYLQARVTKIPSFERLMLDYLQRKYGLPQVFSASKTPITSPTKDQQEDPAQYQAFQRIAYPNSLVKSLPPAPDDNMSEMMLQAANCDHIPLPTHFVDTVNQNLAAGQYNLTHVAFALRLVTDNGCNYFSPEQTRAISDQTVQGMQQLTGNSNISADLRYEAAAFLYETGQSDLVSQSVLENIVAKQLPNGSWSQSGNDTQPRDHTTLLAIWALLAANDPNAPNEPMIRRPN